MTSTASTAIVTAARSTRTRLMMLQIRATRITARPPRAPWEASTSRRAEGARASATTARIPPRPQNNSPGNDPTPSRPTIAARREFGGPAGSTSPGGGSPIAQVVLEVVVERVDDGPTTGAPGEQHHDHGDAQDGQDDRDPGADPARPHHARAREHPVRG